MHMKTMERNEASPGNFSHCEINSNMSHSQNLNGTAEVSRLKISFPGKSLIMEHDSNLSRRIRNV